jgi:single-strand DNA-binding protein
MENLVILVGRLGKDPELKYTPGGTPVAKLSVATSEGWRDKETGERKERTEWHRVEAWNKLAETCAEHLKSGALVYVQGALHKTSWEPAPGVISHNAIVKAKKVKFL